MAKYTEYYSLEKPDGSDKAQISTLNKNFDKRDFFLSNKMTFS